MRMVRSRAAEWEIDPDRVGVMGFSAGGELATLACFVLRRRGRVENGRAPAAESAAAVRWRIQRAARASE